MSKMNNFMEMAYKLAEQSKCTKKGVAALIIKDKTIISSGVNGGISGYENSCEDFGIICGNCGKTTILKPDITYGMNFMAIAKTFDKKTDNFFEAKCGYCGATYAYTEDTLYDIYDKKIKDPNLKFITKDTTLHAEENAILHASKLGINIDGSIMVVTLSPCIRCARMIIESGIKEVYYSEEHSDIKGLELLRRSIHVERIEI